MAAKSSRKSAKETPAEMPVFKFGEICSWHRGSYDLIRTSAQQGRLHHANLLVGPAGTGKRLLAAAVASFILCEQFANSQTACSNCTNCQLQKAGTHPDVIEIDWVDQATVISNDQIRRLCAQLNLTATAGSWRVAVIHKAHSMTAAAANSLLKTLEEPGAASVLFLLADRDAGLPVTIKSRCQRINLPPPGYQDALAWLAEKGLAERETALEFAHGAPLMALQNAATYDYAALQGMRKHWDDYLLRRGEIVSLAEQAAKLLTTREALSLFLTWTTRQMRDVELAADVPAHRMAARRRYLSRAVEILQRGLRQDNASLKTQPVVEGILADIRLIRSSIRAENIL